MIANVGVWSAIAGIITALCLIVAAVLFMLYRQDRLNDDVEAILRRIDPQPATVPDEETTVEPAGFVPWQEPSHVAAERIRQGIPDDAPISIDMQTGAVKRLSPEEAERARRTYQSITDYRNRLEKGGLF
jgi:hypothetical protein